MVEPDYIPTKNFHQQEGFQLLRILASTWYCHVSIIYFICSSECVLVTPGFNLHFLAVICLLVVWIYTFEVYFFSLFIFFKKMQLFAFLVIYQIIDCRYLQWVDCRSLSLKKFFLIFWSLISFFLYGFFCIMFEKSSTPRS